MNPFMDRLREAFSRLTGKQRVQLVLAAAATLGLVWGFTTYVNRVRYGVLFSNLEREDAGSVMMALKERNVEYRLTAGGSIIEVPAGRVDELRLELASDGLPMGGGVGFELFDKPAFGMSNFVQNVNYRRALERELGRTIQKLDTVESARVHLALPPESVFADEHRKPTASVVVGLRGGALANDRVQAIAHLVASGVEGLEPADVSVIDGEGRMLSSGGDESQAGMSASQSDAKLAMERGIEGTLLSILEPVVGAGRVRARATVDLDMTRIERVQETFDPQGAVVRSEEKSKSKQRGSAGGGGIPGTASNLPGGQPGSAGDSGSSAETQSSTTNFEINKTVSTIREPVGQLARQSVAIVVDHALVDTSDGQGEPALEPRPRSPEEMRQIDELVRAAIGFDAERGDQVIVQNIPFDAAPVETGDGGGMMWDLLLTIARYASLPLAVLLLALLVIRPALAVLRGLRDPLPAGALGDGVPTVAQLQAQLRQQLPSGHLSHLTDGGSPLRRKLIEGVQEDPQTAALVIRNWLQPGRERG